MIDATCVAFSGFFLREDSWSIVRSEFRQLVCVDNYRDLLELTVEDYISRMIDIIYLTDPPHIFVGHSMGAFLAITCAERSKFKPKCIVFLGGLAVRPNMSILESYQLSGQTVVSDLCRLDYSNGAVHLNDEAQFAEQLGIKKSFSPKIAESEPAMLLLGSTSNGAGGLSTPKLYFAMAQDNMVPLNKQIEAADILSSELFIMPGDHLEALRSPSVWLRQLEKFLK